MRAVFYLIFLFFLVQAKAQQIASRNHTPHTGFPSSESYCALQDKKGYLWFGTDAGVCRYDGYTYSVYSAEKGLNDHTIFKMYEDFTDRIWFVGISKRIAYYLPEKDSIVEIAANAELTRLLAGTSISSLYVDKEKNLHIGLNTATFFVKITPANNYRTISKEVCPTNGWYISTPTEKEILFSVIAHTFEKTRLTFFKKQDKSDKFMKAKYVQEGNEFYFFKRQRHGTRTRQGIVFSEHNVLLSYKNDSVFSRNMDKGEIISLYCDSRNDLWCGIKNKGVLRFNNSDINSKPDTFLANLSVSSVIQDLQQGYWFTTLSKGVIYMASLDFNYYSIEHGAGAQKINSLVSYKNNIYSIDENQRVNVLEGGKMKVLKNQKGIGIHLLHSSSKEVFIGGDYSYFLNPETGNKRYFYAEKKKRKCFFRKVIPYNKERIYGIYVNGLCEINTNTATIKVLTKDNMNLNSLFLHQDTLWYGGVNGLFIYDIREKDSVKRVTQIMNKRIDHILMDKQHRLWLASKYSGIYVLYKNKLKHLGLREGLLSEQCKTLIADSSGTIWAGTNGGISKISTINDSTFSIENYSSANGLVTDEINQLCLQDQYIYAATSEGIVEFQKNKLKKNTTSPMVYILGTQANDEYLNTNELQALHYKQNFIRINFVGLSYKNPQKTKYQYRLLGLDSSWKYTAATRVEYNPLSPGEYQFEVYAIDPDGNKSTSRAIISFTIQKPFWTTYWFMTLSVTVLGIAIYFYYHTRITRIRKTEEEKTKLNKKIAEVELKAIRSQMNPHFIFNSINSIQHYVLTNDADNAYRYLSKFSRLIRNVLENSMQEFISLQREIETTELYIELEKLRFEKKFRHEIYIDETLNIRTISISPLLIQPYVENAIWHGLMHKKEAGCVRISFLDKEMEVLCVIEDDGIGLEESLKIKAINQKKHQSLALTINQERLDILGKLHNMKLQFSVRDKKQMGGGGTGTIIELRIPKINYHKYDKDHNS